MKRILLCAVALTSLTASAQLTIDNTDLKWTIGNEWYQDVYSKTEADIDTVKGTGKTWDFSAFTNPADSDTVRVISHVSQEFEVKSDVILGASFKANGSDFDQYSVSTFNFSTPTAVGLPHTYGKKWSGNTTVLVPVTINSEIIGEGTIKLPNGINEPVLLQKQAITSSVINFTFYYWESEKYGRLAFFINGQLCLMRDNNFAPVANSINDVEQKSLSVYPNPATSIANVNLANDVKSVQVFDLLGNKVKEVATNNATQVQFNVADLKKGMYMVKAVGTKKSYTSTFVVK